MNEHKIETQAPKPRATAEWQDKVQALHELIPLAKARLERNIWGYLIGGTETETALRRNRLALDELAFRPRYLVDVSSIDLSCTLFGRQLRAPVIMAPVGSLESFHPEGAAAVARAAARQQVMMALSSVSQPDLEETAASAPGAPRIYQLYVKGDDAWVDERAARAIAAGYDAFCLTIDVPLYSRRERDIANRFVKPWRNNKVVESYLDKLSWRQVARFKERHDIPLALKGIMTAEDALLAVEHGVEAIWVSNHGGRQLDHAVGSLTVLPEIVEAVAGRASIIFDGGIWRGSDVLKALALGADAVAVGRLNALSLGAGGEEGVVRALDLLLEEIWTSMGLLGVTCLAELTPERVMAAPATRDPHVFSAFPLLDKKIIEDLL